ncbi:hypothetical protein [Pandoraea anhela]|uniref:Uncharacterized protein n=1 Tax=Pandoraea anhela TaxID=2508295 RepID=A0A5E4S6T3_9BURK|nr:hypothetical protein [Pandoraea anhela]VVD70921.1 hypothetical protein PAN31108_00622 [Pandoraea anhela]
MPKADHMPPKKVFLDTQFVEWDDFAEIADKSPRFKNYSADARHAYKSARAIRTISLVMNALHTERSAADDSDSPNYMGSISDHATEGLFFAIEELANRAQDCILRMSKTIAEDLNGGAK